MTTFKEIQGRNIRSYTTNPDNPLEGQMWYNQTELKLKGVTASGAWASGAPLSTARNTIAGAGIQTAALMIGGNNPGATQKGNVEEFNGSGYSEINDLNTARSQSGAAGTTSAAVVFGGDVYPTSPRNTGATEEYSGSSWSEQNDLGTARRSLVGLGTQTASLGAGGYTTTIVTNVEEYNGSSWTAVNSLPTAKNSFGGAGIQTSALTFAGTTSPGAVATSEEYDGTNWTTGGTMNTARSGVGRGSTGTQNACLAFGGVIPPPAASNLNEQYDGTSWSVQPTLSTARREGGAAGTSIAALYSGGASPTYVAVTEEYNFTSDTITAAAWASGGVLGTARDEGGAAANAVSDAALYFGGYNGSALGITEEYNGLSWSEQNDLGTARSGRLGGAGTQTAGLCFGGNPGGALNEEYDGTSWTERGDLNTPRSQLCGVGISTAALAYGGQTTPSGLNNTEEYDGSSWTAQNTLNTARYGFSGAGLQTSALAFCGVQSPPTISNDTEEYNGTSWTSVNDMIQPAFNHGGSGAQTAALLFGGQTGTSTGGAKTSAAFGYDGTNWSTRPSMGTTRSQISGSSGTSNISAAAFGGTIPPYSTATEEFTGETTAVNIVDITTS